MLQKVRDRLLGMMAVEKGLIKEKDLTKCLNISEFSDNKTMKDVLIEQGCLTKYKADKLERILERQSNPESARMPAKPSEKPFGELAVERGACDQAAVDAALAEQKEFASAKVNIPIGQILMSRGDLTTNDVAAIIERQGRVRLQCDVDSCGKQFNVTGYDEDKFYTCPSCDGDLVPSEIEMIERAKLEARLAKIRAPKPKPKPKPAADPDPWADDDDDDLDLSFDDDDDDGPEIDDDDLDFGDDDDDDDDEDDFEDDDSGDGLEDLMILEL